MNADEMFTALGYAAIAFQAEVTPATAAVYCDQLGDYQTQTIIEAVRRAVARCSRFPTVHDIRIEIKEIKHRDRDPVVARNMRIADVVYEMRRKGIEQEKIDAAITKMETVTPIVLELSATKRFQ